MTDVAASPPAFSEAGTQAGAGHPDSPRQTSPSPAISTEERLDRLSYAVDKSLRYHQRRRGFFDATHSFVMFGVLICGSAAFAGAWPAFAGAVAAILGALDLVFQFSHKARDHQLLFQRFSNLNVDLRTLKSTDIIGLENAEKQRLKIEADEPPVYWALDADCDNEVCVAWGRDKTAGVVELTKLQRMLMNFFRFDRAVFPARKII
jgi:hypothetical protein